MVAIPAAGVPAVIEEAGRARVRRRGGLRRRASARRRRAPRSRRRCARGDAVVAAGLRAELRRADLAPLARGAVGRRAGGAAARVTSRWSPRAATSWSTRWPRGAGCACTRRSRRGNEAVRHDAGLGRAPRARSTACGRSRCSSRPTATARGCARRSPCAPTQGVGVAVLKVGASAAGAAAAAAHTGAVAGRPPRLPRARRGGGRGMGGRRPRPARAGERRSRRPGRRGRAAAALAILTCSGGDSGLGADEAARVGLPLPPLAPHTVAALRDAAARGRDGRATRSTTRR